MAKGRRAPWQSPGWWRWQVSRPFVWLSEKVAWIRRKRRLTDAEQWRQWQLDVKVIQRQITHTFNRRFVFREIQKIFQTNAALGADGGFIYEWLLELYGHFIAMAVRREIDRAMDALSLRRLLTEIIQRPRAFTKQRYFDHFIDTPEHPDFLKEHRREMNERDWATLGGGGEFIDIEMVRRDREQLEDEAAAVKRYADKIVAHRAVRLLPDNKIPEPTPAEVEEVKLTVKEVDNALDHIETILRKYYVLLTASSLMGAEPTMQFDWSKPFSYPWQPRP